MPQLFDTHAHLNLKEFSDDWREVADNSLAKGVFVINVGVNYLSSQKAVDIAREYGHGLWAAIGLHPENIITGGENKITDGCIPENIKEIDFDANAYSNLAKSCSKVVAIGEIGLDYLRLPKNEALAQAIKEKQKDIFKKQLMFARQMNLPVIIHSRMAHNDLIESLKKDFKTSGPVGGVVHCFTGTVEDARQYYDLGLYFGLNGIIFKYDINDAIAKMPLDRILFETDCPYLSPSKEIKRNEPQYISLIAERVAQIRNEPMEAVIEAANENSKRLFCIRI